jgi:hypothetical protein
MERMKKRMERMERMKKKRKKRNCLQSKSRVRNSLNKASPRNQKNLFNKGSRSLLNKRRRRERKG